MIYVRLQAPDRNFHYFRLHYPTGILKIVSIVRDLLQYRRNVAHRNGCRIIHRVGGILPRRNAEYDGCLRITRDSA